MSDHETPAFPRQGPQDTHVPLFSLTPEDAKPRTVTPGDVAAGIVTGWLGRVCGIEVEPWQRALIDRIWPR